MKVFLKNYITVGLLPPVGGENAKKGPPGAARTPEQSLFHIFPDFSKILFLETLTGYPDASDA